MKKSRLLILCVLFTMSTVFATACGNDGNNNGSEAPYQDETNNDVNGGTDMNGTNSMNNGTGTGTQNGGSNLQDAGRNLMDSVEDAGGAIMDGVRDMTGTNGNNTTNNNGR